MVLIINLIAQGRPGSLVVVKSGKILTVNGAAYDFSGLPDGATYPAGEVPCEWVVGSVERIGDALSITLVLPCDYGAPAERLSPQPIINPPDGLIVFPGDPHGTTPPDVEPGVEPWVVDPAKIITAEQKLAAGREATKTAFEVAIQAYIDAKPREKDFRDGVTLASYAADEDEPLWADQAKAFIKWRTAVWKYAYAELAKALSGERAIPTVEAFLTELPAIVWPD